MTSFLPARELLNRLRRAVVATPAFLALVGSATGGVGDPSVDFTTPGQSPAESAGTVAVTLTLSGVHTVDVTVPFTVSGSATLTDDFTHTPSPAVIPAGQLTVDIDVTLVPDLLHEDDETVILTMGMPTNGNAGPVVEHTLTIGDDDAAPEIEFSMPSSQHGEGAGVTGIAYELNAVSGLPVTAVITLSGSAAETVDYTIDSTTATIPAGQLWGTATITITGDMLDELDETAILTLGAPMSATLGATNVHTLTIQDDDDPPTLDFTLATRLVDEDQGDVPIEFVLSEISGLAVGAELALTGTAAENDDYTIDTTTISIPAGQTTAIVNVTLTDDALNELDEAVILTLGSPSNVTFGPTDEHTLTIKDDDPLPSVSFRYRRDQADEPDGVVPVRVVLSNVSGRDVVLPVIASGSALDPSDYTIQMNPLVILAGQLTSSLLIDLVDDAVPERNEDLTLVFDGGGLDGAIPGPVTSTTIVVVDDDEVTYEPTVPGLRPSELAVTFAEARVGEASSPHPILLQNTGNVSVTLNDVLINGDGAMDYTVTHSVALPILLDPGDIATFDVVFDSFDGGDRLAELRVVQTPAGAPETIIGLSGRAYGATGQEIVMNVGPNPYLDLGQQLWVADYGSVGTSAYIVYPGEIAGTDDDELFHESRFGSNFGYSWNLPSGFYDVELHFVDPVMIETGFRVFDVAAEGQVFLDDLDLFATIGAVRTAYVAEPHRVQVTDGTLDLDFDASEGDAIVAAITVRSVPVINSLTAAIDFGVVDQAASVTDTADLQNIGLHTGTVTSVTWVLDASSVGTAEDFYVEIAGTKFFGGVSTVSHVVSMPLPGMMTTPLVVGFEPSEHQDNQAVLRIEGDFDEMVEITVDGTGGADVGWGFMHPVPDAVPALVIDYDGDGQEEVQLLGNESHTHEPGHVIVAHEWTQGGGVISNIDDPAVFFNTGQTTVELTITDDNNPASTATDNMTISVFPPDEVPGILVSYYEATSGTPQDLLDAVPTNASYIERVMALEIDEVEGTAGASPFAGSVMIRIQADFEVSQVQDMHFVPAGGAGDRVEIDGVAHTAAEQFSIGTHSLEARFAVDSVADLPVKLDVFINGQPVQGYGAGLKHSVNGVVPVIHEMPSVGLDLGGNLIVITGFGFWPRDLVTVHWGVGGPDYTFPGGDFVSWTGEEVSFLSPPGTGTVEVTIETPAGITTPHIFQYSPTGPVPIDWTRLPDVDLPGPTTSAWGPDGRLYVGQISGEITALTFDGDYNVTASETYVGISNLTNFDLCGIAFNPYDGPAGPVQVYVAHGEHFLSGGGSFSGPSPFTGQVSVLTGPNFDAPTPLVTQLPTSNHDHGTNGILFDGNGDLLIAQGGNTNAGIKWPLIGDVPESVLSGSIVKAFTSRPGFNGQILYEATSTGTPIDDQVLGKHISISDGVDVEVHAPGLRNGFDLALTTWGFLYATDNGPNSNYGPASTSATTNGGGVHPQTSDELMHIERGVYYGHPNRNRGRFDDRQNVYRDTIEPSEPGVFRQNLTTVDSSTNGLTEYRSTAFNSQLRGYLMAQKWNDLPRLVELSADKRSVESITTQNAPQMEGLGLLTGPGGAVLSTNFTDNRIEISVPNDVGAVGVTAYDITPWRASAAGGQLFVIGGVNFGNLGNTTVHVDGLPAALTSVTAKRIVGTLPPSLTGTASELLDVQVTVGLDSTTIPAAFAYLPSGPGQQDGAWTDGSSMSQPLGEVACGIVGKKMYLFGEGNSLSYSYDLYDDFWSASPAPRPSAGNHHACEVYGGKVYLFGGFAGGAGEVQIYDPVLNSWTMGAPMSWSGGSCSSAVIGDRIYVSGGIVGANTVSNFAAYEPATDTWFPLAPMPTGVNHAASGTDGSRFFVFGGRGGGNFPQPGFNTVQVYNPATNTWDSSDMPASTLAPMPLGRGGTGKAVFYFGNFLVIGGESSTQVFDEVQVYDPVANTWSEDAPMPTARHGMFPVEFESRVIVAGGGTNAGASMSDVVEIFTHQ
ncbi:MAG: hypothetical protein GY711_20635 [bacterium]|nr:hypothetical protein [bacterium]